AALDIRVTLRTVDRTWVEKEALTSACAAARTVYDMCKSEDRGMVTEQVQLEHKAGGRSGTLTRQPGTEARASTRQPRKKTGRK
ncbi:MAG TPA: cyclic pyranopterin monophosphate synthase MoaC, partial [Myxococcaceae bacterium]|nr:cyclic pyranopterin monophosphate synthase MoaC [Myxococcaceae bacterium]